MPHISLSESSTDATWNVAVLPEECPDPSPRLATLHGTGLSATRADNGAAASLLLGPPERRLAIGLPGEHERSVDGLGSRHPRARSSGVGVATHERECLPVAGIGPDEMRSEVHDTALAAEPAQGGAEDQPPGWTYGSIEPTATNPSVPASMPNAP